MTNSPLSGFRILVVPDLHEEGDTTHWPPCWAQALARVEQVEQRFPAVPDLHAWSEQIGHVLRRSVRPALIVAQGFACLAATHRALSGFSALQALLLIDPPDPLRFGIDESCLAGPLPVPATLFAGSGAGMCTDRVEYWADRWQCTVVNAGPRAVLSHLERLAASLPAPRACRCGEASEAGEAAQRTKSR